MDGAVSNTQSATIRQAVMLAWPASLASMATPLLGLVDVWALARSDRPLDIAAVGLASVIFALAYWSLGFIRMSVAGLTAQAHGAGDNVEVRATLSRGLVLGASLGGVLVLLQWPMSELSFRILAVGSEASAETFASAETYFAIRIWGAPFVIGVYALFGWLIALERTDYLMLASLSMTLINTVLDYWFVVGFGWGAAGVAAGTLIAEIVGFLISLAFVALMLRKTGGLKAHWSKQRFWDRDALSRTLTVNFDIFIRTFLLAICFAWFLQRSSSFGDVTLAANQALLQLFLFTGLALDGSAIAAETLVGQSVGDPDKARGRTRFIAAIRSTSVPAGIAAIFFAVLYIFVGDGMVMHLTPKGEIRDVALRYLPWVAVSPMLLLVAFQLDGIFIGATRSREMRDSMIICAAVLLPSSIIFENLMGNHGLWLAFSLYFVLRGGTLAAYMPRLFRSFKAPTSESATVVRE
ncbi:MAG: MATE family efflux transporter [Pseudomonadota bacterium]